MNRQALLTHLICIVLAGSHVTCSIADFDEDDSERIPLTKDIRVYARQARAGLASLSPEQRALVAPKLIAHEQAIARYDRLLAKGKARRRWQGPLIGTSAFLLADDVTGFGVANDIAIPFLARPKHVTTKNDRSDARRESYVASDNREHHGDLARFTGSDGVLSGAVLVRADSAPDAARLGP